MGRSPSQPAQPRKPFLPNPALAAQLEATGLPEAQAYAALVAAEGEAGRSCGTCALCCHVVGVPELDKAPSTACAHLCSSASGACGIYADRPGGCRVYACAWKLGLGDPERDRPDRLGGLLEWADLDAEFHPYAGYWILRVAHAPDGDITRYEAAVYNDLIDELRVLGCLVLVYLGAGQPLTMLYPDGTEDAEAGTAPSWEAEQAGECMGFRVAYYESYADGLEDDTRARIESGELPF